MPDPALESLWQARISFLEGERQGQEQLKRDLLRRVKMLEYALQLERSGCTQLSARRC